MVSSGEKMGIKGFIISVNQIAPDKILHFLLTLRTGAKILVFTYPGFQAGATKISSQRDFCKTEYLMD